MIAYYINDLNLVNETHFFRNQPSHAVRNEHCRRLWVSKTIEQAYIPILIIM